MAGPDGLDGMDGPNVSELASRLHLAAIHLLRRLRREDTALGLSASQLSAITTLVRGGQMTVGELARAEGVKPPTMTRLVQALERDGIVIRSAAADDGRVSRIRHTTRAIKLLEDGRAARERAFGEDLRALPEGDLRLLDRCAALMERLSEAAD